MQFDCLVWKLSRSETLASIAASQNGLRKVFDSKLKMQTNMNDLIELMSIIGSLENQKRKDIDQGSTHYLPGYSLPSKSVSFWIFHGWDEPCERDNWTNVLLQALVISNDFYWNKKNYKKSAEYKNFDLILSRCGIWAKF